MKKLVFCVLSLFISTFSLVISSNAQTVSLGSGDGIASLWFFDDGAPQGQRFLWDDAASQFRLSASLKIDGTTISFGSAESIFDAGANLIGTNGSLQVGGSLTVSGAFSTQGSLVASTHVGGSELRSNGNIFLNHDGPDGDSVLYFFNSGSSFGESLRWSDPGNRFEFSEAIQTPDNLIAGSSLAASWNAFGSLTPASGHITGDQDVMVSDDLEVGDSVYLSKNLYMEGSTSSGGDGTQTIFFYNNGSRIAESLRWSDTGSLFEFSDTLLVSANLLAGRTSKVSYNAFGINSPASGAITTAQDVMISSDAEIGGNLYLSDRIYLNGSNSSGQDGDQTIYFYEGGSRTGESLFWDDGEDEFFITDSMGINGSLRIANSLVTTSNSMRFSSDDDNSSSSTAIFAWYQNGISNANRLMQLQSSNGGDLFIGGQLVQNHSFDIAESFFMSDRVEPGDLVAIDPERQDAVRLTTGAYDPLTIGVVSTKPGIILGGAAFSVDALRQSWGEEVAALYVAERTNLVGEILEDDADLRANRDRLVSQDTYVTEKLANDTDTSGAETDYREQYRAEKVALEEFLEDRALQLFSKRYFAPVALAGRVPVHVDATIAPIQVGDYLTPSPTPGVAMKAVQPGPVIGTALEGLGEGRGTVVAFIHRGWFGSGEPATAPPSQAAVLDSDPGAGTPVITSQIVLQQGDGEVGGLTVLKASTSGVGEELLRLDDEGNLHLKGAIRTTSHTLAEYHPVSEPVEAGDVVVVDRNLPGAFRPGDQQADPAVVGIVSGKPGIVLGSRITEIADLVPELAVALEEAQRTGDRGARDRIWRDMQRTFESVHAPIAMSGTVLAKVDAGYGAVQAGDLLIVSPTYGHAMRSSLAAPGTVVGKALEPLAAGTGMIQVLVMLR